MQRFIALFLIILLTDISPVPEMDNAEQAPFDRSVLSALAQLDCPFTVGPDFKTVSGFDRIIEENGLILLQSWPREPGQVELYAGKEGALLAALRDKDQVYCAQYINGRIISGSISDAADDCIYFHESASIGSGIYIKTGIAFFLNGKEAVRTYYDPDGEQPDMMKFSNTLSILPADIDLKSILLQEPQGYSFTEDDRQEFLLTVDHQPKGKISVFLPPDHGFIAVPVLAILSALDIPTETHNDEITFFVNEKPCVINTHSCTLEYDGGGNILLPPPGSLNSGYQFWDGTDLYVDTELFLAFSHSVLKICITADYDSMILAVSSL